MNSTIGKVKFSFSATSKKKTQKKTIYILEHAFISVKPHMYSQDFFAALKNKWLFLKVTERSLNRDSRFELPWKDILLDVDHISSAQYSHSSETTQKNRLKSNKV